MPNLWLLPRPLILASKSQARRALLAAAGIPFEGIDADIDERLVEGPARAAGAGGEAIAALLAREKAMEVSAGHPDRLVLGADQTLSIEGRFLTKPVDLVAAKAQLLGMAGRMHVLHAALCLVRDGAVVASACAEARMTCRAYSEAFVDCYLDFVGEDVLRSVGGYAVEGLGIHLFESIIGEQSTILGLPMLPLLALLRDEGAVEI
jgi:septum formation protein